MNSFRKLSEKSTFETFFIMNEIICVQMQVRRDLKLKPDAYGWPTLRQFWIIEEVEKKVSSEKT